MKTAVEGKDFQTARKEVEAQRHGEIPEQRPESEKGEAHSPARPGGGPGPSHGGTGRVHRRDHGSEGPEDEDGDQEVGGPGPGTVPGETKTRPVSQPKDPLLFDLDGRGPQTTGEAGSVLFDLQGEGQAQRTSFVQGGSAFLALDRNGNGVIDNGLELFGDQHGAQDGYEELRRFDGNLDGRIDGQDAVFRSLSLLFANGSTLALQDAGIASIQLDATASGQITATGDTILRSAVASRLDGSLLGTYAMGLQQFDVTA
ncbi:MAG: hypothetical protein HY823_01570 [Acidobacteria bacterium]|nr:hypothetical protein [Acidobacteriota bacterium]